MVGTVLHGRDCLTRGGRDCLTPRMAQFTETEKRSSDAAEREVVATVLTASVLSDCLDPNDCLKQLFKLLKRLS